MPSKLANLIWALGAKGNPDCAALVVLNPREMPEDAMHAMT